MSDGSPPAGGAGNAPSRPASDEQGAHVNPWLTAVAVMFGTFMVVLDTTVVNVSLSHIAGSLSATVEESTWVLTSYIAANAVVLPMTGWLASLFGRKRLLILSITSFTAASMLCGVAPNLLVLVIFRVMQGATGGVMQPLSQAILLEAFPPHERGKAMGFWGLGIVVAPILGPVLGGWLTDNYSWRWVFYINIPIGVVSVLLTRLWVFDPAYLRRAASATIDYLGLSLLAIGAGCLQVMLDRGQEEDWFDSTLIVGLAVAAMFGLVTFCWRELRSRHPIVDLHVFRHRTFAVGVLLMTALGFVLFGSLVLMPVMMQSLYGYPSLQAGIALAPRGMGSFIAMPVVGLLTSRVDPRKLIAVGLAVGAWTLIWLGSINLQAGYWDFFWPQVIQGVALGLLFVPLTTVAMADLPREEIGNASSLFNLMRNVGSSVGIAAVATLLTRTRVTHAAVLSEHISPYNPASEATRQALGRLLGTPNDLVALAAMNGMVQRQASMLAFVDLFRLLGIVFIVLIPVVFLMRRPAASQPVAAVVE
ncbi:MAG: DHA2 family efflux MFS transporter permease subunit [Acidobacteria bacterium]|nr:DHA2 family efflux MFS transporter permease subunit [Acidobacteriota bacterium]